MKFEGKIETDLQSVHLYGDPSARTLDLYEIADYLRERLGKISVDVRQPLFKPPNALDELARNIASTKIRDLTKPWSAAEPLPGEIEFERKLLLDPGLRLVGILYDGFRLQTIARELLPFGELALGHVHIVFTNRLFGTWGEGDRRYHIRVSVYGFPSLISTTGIVEGPAKPKEYYTLKHRYLALGSPIDLEELKEDFRGRFIDYDDERMTEVMKGYVMQALFYHLTFDPFCGVKTCRLFNAHWQEEVILAQLGPKGSEFCERHAAILEELKSRASPGNL